MVISSLIHSMRMSSILSVVIHLPHMHMTLSLRIRLVSPGTLMLPLYRLHFNIVLLCLRMRPQMAGQILLLGPNLLSRRLRIRTLQYGTAANINELYDGVDSESILSILVHKVILASLEQGVREGRMLLHDWLVILTAQYNDAYKLVQYDNGTSVSRVDVAFLQCPQLQPLPRLVFALLRNPLLRFHEDGVHPDYRIYLQCLFSALEPTSLNQAIYPVLTSYATPDKQAYPRHSLSRAALITSGSPIFFLDAFTNLIVYYSSTADPSLPFPPPHDCLLRSMINRLKQERISHQNLHLSGRPR
ncbi:protein transport protein SEC23 [Iris pallida]|uniref:Protein transport protein SEC23 n=1 Tax=Iris pallida TaxID=29817 RepID=A0AAX6EGG3_IRIPA|nr:protein transport protein SEC23 [Iris pallida]